MTSKDIIGARAHIAFPHDSDRSVLAKVDTGADFSSVWASEIEEKDGKLSFVLFAQGSQFYTGKRHYSESFSVTNVKNSFGHIESRYKVKLLVKIGKRRIKAEFNLADRSRNRYPVLIGKRTLTGKFLVDTRLAPSSDGVKKDQRVLIFNSYDSKRIEQFTEKLTEQTKNLICEYSTYDDLIIQLGEESNIIRNSTGESLDPYDLFYFKTHAKRQEFAVALSDLFKARAYSFIDKEISHGISNSKITQYVKLWLKGLPLPKTIIVNQSIISSQYHRFVGYLGLPFILKDPEADKGLRNYLIESREQFEKIVTDQSVADQKYYIAQEFIPNSGDLRLLVFHTKVGLIISRHLEDGNDSHLNNTSLGGVASLVDVDDCEVSVKNMAVHAALAMDRRVAGVDMIQHSKSGEWYILEVNNSPQLASGAFVDEKIKVFGAFLRQYAKK